MTNARMKRCWDEFRPHMKWTCSTAQRPFWHWPVIRRGPVWHPVPSIMICAFGISLAWIRRCVAFAHCSRARIIRSVVCSTAAPATWYWWCRAIRRQRCWTATASRSWNVSKVTNTLRICQRRRVTPPSWRLARGTRIERRSFWRAPWIRRYAFGARPPPASTSPS